MSYGQHFKAYQRKADSLFTANEFEKASDYYMKALKAIDERYVEPIELFNIAKSFSMSKDTSRAMLYLFKLVKKGGIASDFLEKASEFNPMKETLGWQHLMNETRMLEKKADSSLIRTLRTIGDSDQFYRRKIDSLYQVKSANKELRTAYIKMQRLQDSINLDQIKLILEEKGYPSRVSVGKYNTVVFYVIQHADLEIQEKYYPRFEEAARAGDLSWRTLCLLTDRIRVRKGIKQIYGTQFKTNADGASEICEVEDFDNLDSRRLQIGLEPIREYALRFGIKL